MKPQESVRSYVTKLLIVHKRGGDKGMRRSLR